MRKKNLEHPIVFTQHENLYTTAPQSTPAAAIPVSAISLESQALTRRRRRRGSESRRVDTPIEALRSKRSPTLSRPQPCPRHPSVELGASPRGRCRSLRPGRLPLILAAIARRLCSSRGERRASDRPRSTDVSFAPRVVRPRRTPSITRRRHMPSRVIACTTPPRHATTPALRCGAQRVASWPSSPPPLHRRRRPLASPRFPRCVEPLVSGRLHRETPAGCDPSMHPAAVGSRLLSSSRSSLSLSVVGVARPRPRLEARPEHDTKPACRQRSLTRPGEEGRHRIAPSGAERLVATSSAGRSCRAPPGWSTLLEYNGRMPAAGGRAVRLGARRRRIALER